MCKRDVLSGVSTTRPDVEFEERPRHWRRGQVCMNMLGATDAYG
jgi:hypothetical protein